MKISGAQDFSFSRSYRLLKDFQLKISAPSPPHRPSTVPGCSRLSVKRCVAQLTGPAGTKPSLPPRPPRPRALGTTNATRTQMFMKRAWRESSFQCAVSARFPVLFNHIYYSFCIPVTPCGSYLDCSLSKSPCQQRPTGVKNNKSENRERTLQHWAEGLLLCLTTPEARNAQVSLTQQSNLLAACDAVPLTPQPQLSRQIEKQYYTGCYTFPLGRIHHCQADTPWWKKLVLLTELLRSSTATPNCTLHSAISVCASCTSDF